MKSYIMVSFIMGCICISIRMLFILCLKYPRTTKSTLSSDVGVMLTSIGFAIWAGVLIF